jgi:hypothetical protein
MLNNVAQRRVSMHTFSSPTSPQAAVSQLILVSNHIIVGTDDRILLFTRWSWRATSIVLVQLAATSAWVVMLD